MKKIASLYLYLTLLSFTLAAQTNIDTGIPSDKIMIDPMNATGGSAAKIFDHITYIPLETTKESLFGEIDQLQITDEYFIILDHSTEFIFFFTKKGQFHHKISKFTFDVEYNQPARPGYAPHKISSFKVVPGKDQLVIQSVFESHCLYVLDFEGKRIRKQAMPLNTQDYFFFKNGDSVYKQSRPFANRPMDKYQPFDLSIHKRTGTAPQYFFPVDFRHAALWGDLYAHLSYLTYAGDAYHCIYTPDFDYNAYELDTTGIIHKYQFIFPMLYSIPPDFGYDSSYTNKRIAYLKDKDLFTNLWKMYKTGNYIIIDLRCASGRLNPNNFSLLYSLKTSRLLTLDRITADSSSYYLPVSGNQKSEILACEEDNLFISYSSLAMFAAKEAAVEKHPQYSPLLNNYFTTQGRKANPVIVQLKLKDNL